MKKRGTSLIEVLVYIALYSVLIGGAVIGVYSITAVSSSNETHALIGLESAFVRAALEESYTHADKQPSLTVRDRVLILNGSALTGTHFRVDNLEVTHTDTPPRTTIAFLLSATSTEGRLVSEEFTFFTYATK